MTSTPEERALSQSQIPLRIASNRRASTYSRVEIFRRLIWGGVRPLFHYSPRPCFAWRRFLLRCMGASVGREVHVYPSAQIYYPWMISVGDHAAIGEHAIVYSLGRIVIGKRATISQRAHLCAGTHDYRDPTLPLQRPPITIGADAWVCADAFVGPGISVGDGAVIGARAAVFRNVEPWTIVGGNPARFIKLRVMKERNTG